ncbi:hypothetical protein NLD30_07610 [SCandidatus Aminicenantes bacterium Aminicenantia_JdfR_composite]|jgi:cell division protein FtsB|nr:hypothetical protein [SCandidatus Aminicenantes bacterium Aminicenantia_JdfR_composite]MCP2605671.1 hypothetical protein [Candidatus Aminicenantes bacterium AC-335-O07]MCP2620564.1 hypothetical protein [Candidatus Aminicenantes bacterium AC-334-E05]
MERLKPLNLAKKPIRNKNFFYFLISVLIIANLFLLILNCYNIIKFTGKSKEVWKSISELEKQINQFQNRKKFYTQKIKKFELIYKREVETLNDLIYKKTFSWTSLLSKLEYSLPNDVIIYSVRPDLRKKKLKLKLEIGAKTTDAFLSFIDSLRENGFQNIKVEKERLRSDGLILVLITLFYPLEV